VESEKDFFRALGASIRELRLKRGYTQEDMLSFGFSVRFWQKVEAGKPITVRTLFRICRIFEAAMHEVMRRAETMGTVRDVAASARRSGRRAHK
jgi:transcriptional regulator with XRE-family HTH domain